MTHPTDEELNALVEKLRDGDCCDTANCNCDTAATAITALRAQLADQKRFKDRIIAEASDAIDAIGKRCDEANARADRAEAALAAQIEADAGALDAVADNWSCGHMPPHCDCARDIEQWKFAADEIRAQPHDRTALDRMLRAEREKALREAADAFMDGSAPRMTILAMMEQTKETK